jgi:SAM-dependent methyltransferase
MSFESLMRAVQRLSASSEALAALGGELRLRQSGEESDPRTRQLLHDVIRGIDSTLLDGVSPEQEAIALAVIRSGYHYTIDLLDKPGRAPGWLHEDEEILQTIGKQSRRLAHQINTFAGRNPEFHQTLTSPGSFLDIGTGVGWLAIEAAQLWPALKIIGVDVWEPSLQLARANIAISGMQNRITVRTQNIVDLDEKEAFTVVFLPAPFLPYEVAVTAIERAYRALVRGGWLIFGIFTSQPDPLGEALAALRIVRCGGYPWKTPEVEERLRGVGFEQIEIFAPGMGSIQVFGRKPAKSGCD